MKIIYTEAADLTLKNFYKKQKESIEKVIIDEKSIFGDEIIEITGHDIEKVTKRIVFIRNKNNRTRVLEILSKVYFLLGVSLVSMGIIYPYLENVILNDLQKLIFLSGMVTTIFSLILGILISEKRKQQIEFRKHQDKVEFDNLVETLHIYRELKEKLQREEEELEIKNPRS